MDVQRILDELRLERNVAGQRLADLDTAIAAFEKFNGAKTATRERTARKGRTVVDWDRARQQYENAGVGVPQIARAFHCHESAVYAHAKTDGWRKPQGKP